MVIRRPADGCQCIGATLERFADTRKRGVWRGASLHKFGERRNGDGSAFARCGVGHGLQHRIADTSVNRIGKTGEGTLHMVPSKKIVTL